MKQKGLSLVEVMVVVAILGIVSLGTMSMMDNTMKAQRGTQAKDQQREVVARIRTLLTNRTACMNTMGGQNAVAGFVVTNIQDSANVTRLSTAAPSNTDQGGLLTYEQFRLGDYNGTTQMATLFVTFRKTGQTIGVKTLTERIAIRIRVTGSTIVDCFAIGTNTDGFWQISPFNTTNIFYGGNFVGIGNDDPEERLEVAGNILADMYLFPSDIRLKEHFVKAPGIEKLSQLHAYSFNWIKDGRPDMGVIAQEIEQELPHLVRTDSKGYKSVNYPGLIPVLIQANQDLYQDQQKLQKRIEELEKHLMELKKQKQ